MEFGLLSRPALTRFPVIAPEVVGYMPPFAPVCPSTRKAALNHRWPRAVYEVWLCEQRALRRLCW